MSWLAEAGIAQLAGGRAIRLGSAAIAALQMLAGEGLVEIIPKRGTFVAQLTLGEARQAFEFRQVIETACAGLAAVRRSDEQLAQMRRLLENGAPRSYERGADFHLLVAEAAANSYLLDTFRSANAKVVLASRTATWAHVARPCAARSARPRS